MSDRVALANAIADAGIERGKAQRVASVIFDAIHDNVAVDVLASGTALRADIQALRHDLQSSDAPLDARITGVSADLALVEHRLLTRLGGLAVVLSGIIIAVLHYWQPHG
jgi:hypothetical protein